MNTFLPPESLGRVVAQSLGWTLLHSLWQGAAVAAALAILLGLFRRSSAALRHALCLAALLVMLAAAVVTLARTERRLVAVRLQPGRAVLADDHLSRLVPEASAEGEPTGNVALTERKRASDSPAVSAPAGVVPTAKNIPSWRARLERSLPWISLGWTLGVLLLSLRHAGGWSRVRRLRRSGVPAPAALQRLLADLCARHGLRAGAVRLLETAREGGPMLTGLLRPIILLPVQAVTGLDAGQLEAVLAHELAHLVRHDTWTNLGLLAAETLFFYHPAVWWIGRRVREERELAADDLTLLVCGDRRLYAGALARLADFQQPPSAYALAATGSHRGSLVFRIRRILQPPTAATASAPAAWGLVLPAALLSAALGLMWAARAQAEGERMINVAPGQSIQAAIDAAPAGAVIHLGAGEWKENLTIAKTLTLEGTGWDRTRVMAAETVPSSRAGDAGSQNGGQAARTAAEKSPPDEYELQTRIQAAKTAAEIDALETDVITRYERPALWVHDARGVVLRGVRVQGSKSYDPRHGRTLAIFQRGEVLVDGCAFVGAAYNGLDIANGAEVEVKNSLVAAVWNKGITVSARDERGEPAGRLHLIDSEVRNAYYAGIGLGPGCDTTLIEHSRISGSAWHGIRYDNASPTITGCTIFGHARSGIYASGPTRATIRGNLFYKNEMDGVSTWFDNTDLIEGNTFAGNLREGITVIGSKPTLSHNIFVGSPVAVMCGMTTPRNGPATSLGDPLMQGNLFWNNQKIVQRGRPEETQPDPVGSLEADPQFREATKLDFTLVPGSPARANGTGAADPLPPGGPWPLLAEEKAIIPAGDTRDARGWRQTIPRNVPVIVMPTPRPPRQASSSAAVSEPRPAVAAASTAAPGEPQPRDNPRAGLLQEANHRAAQQRGAQDRRIYSPPQLQEIESLYQGANRKGLRNEEARASLRQLLEKYDKANRTGCATLYYGQGSQGAERLEYLTRAVEKFSGCYYYNGCQVGGYGRYLLALTLWEAGQKDKARSLVAELRTTYKDATDHRGQPVTGLAAEAEKVFAENP